MKNLTEHRARISNYKIMQSAAGFYIGRTCVIQLKSETGRVVDTYTEPYDRLSGYFDTNELARSELMGA